MYPLASLYPVKISEKILRIQVPQFWNEFLQCLIQRAVINPLRTCWEWKKSFYSRVTDSTVKSIHFIFKKYRTKLIIKTNKENLNIYSWQRKLNYLYLTISVNIDRVINIHPSLLPSFPGLEAWKQALDYGVKVTGCTVHFIDQGVDSGAIIAQDTVPILPTDTPETLHARIQQAEHKLYPEAIAAIASGRVLLKGRQVYVK